jgi:penicillin-binding protein 1B
MPLGVTNRGSLADSSFPAFLDLVKRQLREDYRDED